MEGQKFGRLTVIERAENDKHRNSRWLCKCACGNFITVLAMSLRKGSTKSCGCLRHELKEDAGYGGTHAWLRRNKLKPKLCERCRERPAEELSYNNKDKKGYSQNPKDYEWLCASCHRRKDFGNEVMTKAQIYSIKKLYALGAATQRELAGLFRVSRVTINHIVNREGIYSKTISPEILKISDSWLAELGKKS